MNAVAPVPVAPTPVIVPAIPWYRSPIYIAAMGIVLASLSALFPQIPKILHKAGIVTAWDLAQFLGACATLLGGLAIGAQRLFSRLAPITWSQKGADEHVNTKATVAVQTAMMASGIPTGAVTKDAMLNDPTQAAKDAVPPASSV